MYFSDITDEELVLFHNGVENNFSMPLTDVLASPLFKIETIITNKVYKIYPLFYCEKITSTNPDDEILENKCVIVEKKTDTKLSFNTAKGGAVDWYSFGFATLIEKNEYDEIISTQPFCIICYNKFTLQVIEGIELRLTIFSNEGQGRIAYETEAYSNSDGIIYVDVPVDIMEDLIANTTGLWTIHFNLYYNGEWLGRF